MPLFSAASVAWAVALMVACGGVGSNYIGHEPITDEDGNTVLSSPGGEMRALAVSDQDVFFATGYRGDSQLWAVGKNGGPTRWVGKPGHNVEALVVDDTHVYAATWDGIKRFDRKTGTREKVNRYDGELLEVRAMVDYGDELIFTTKTALYRVSKSIDKPTKIADLETESSWSWALAVDGEYLYFSNRIRVGRIPLSGGEAETLSSKGQLVERSPMFVTDGYIYIDTSIGDGRRIPLGGGQEEKPCKYRHHTRGFAVDGDEWFYGASVGHAGGYTESHGSRKVYKTTKGGGGEGGLMRCFIGQGDKAENLAPSAQSVVAIALEPEAIYWLDTDLGQVVTRSR
jgi:hypothetical protein